MVTIPESEYLQLKIDSENLNKVLNEKYEVMEYFPIVGGYKKINYVSIAANGIKNIIADLQECYKNETKLLKQKFPSYFSKD